jgi:hypothetical protein
MENWLAFFQSHPAFIHAEVVGNFPIVVNVKNRDVGLFTSL